MSKERRQLVTQAGGIAAMSGVWPVLVRQHHEQLYWAGIALVAALEIRLIVKMVRLRRTEGCM